MEIINNLNGVLNELEQKYKLHFMYQLDDTDTNYIWIACYKDGEQLYKRYDTILSTLKFHQGMRRMSHILSQNN